MSDGFVIAIPSSRRSDLINNYAISLIEQYGLHEVSKVYVFCSQEEMAEYQHLEQDYNYITLCQGKPGLIGNLNSIRGYFPEGQCILYMDDDIKGLKSNVSNINYLAEIQGTFSRMKNAGCYLAGVSPSGNAYFCRNKYLIGLYFAVGCFYFEINQKHPMLYFGPGVEYHYGSQCCDFVNTIQHFRYCGLVMRNDNITVNHRYNGIPGGMNNDQHTRQYNRTRITEMLTTEYPTYFNKKAMKTDNPLMLTYEPRFKTNTQILKTLYMKKRGTGTTPGVYYQYVPSTWTKLKDTLNYSIIDSETNLPVAIVIRDAIDPSLWDLTLYRKLNNWTKKSNSNRGDIAGTLETEKLPNFARKIDLDNVKTNSANTRISEGKRHLTNEIHCITLGYYNRRDLSQFDKQLEELNLYHKLDEMLKPLELLYKNIYWKPQQGINPSKSYRNTIFNAVTINKSLRSANHQDKNNSTNHALVFHTSSPYEKNQFRGGDLLFPEYLLALNLRPDRDIVIFDSKNTYHCNDIIHTLDPSAKYNSRMSFVLFSK